MNDRQQKIPRIAYFHFMSPAHIIAEKAPSMAAQTSAVNPKSAPVKVRIS